MIADSTKRLVTLLTMLQGRKYFAVSIYNMMHDLYAALTAGKSSDFTCYLESLPVAAIRELEAKFVDGFRESAGKLESYLGLDHGNPSNKLFKTVRIFDPRQITTISQDIEAYSTVIIELNSADTLEEWPIYVNIAKSEQLPDDFNVISYWQNLKARLPVLSNTAISIITMPVTSVDVERSFSKTNQILTPQRHNLSDDNYKGLAALYFNGELSCDSCQNS